MVIVTLDHKHRAKEMMAYEGGVLDLGCTFMKSRFEIIEKGSNLTTTRPSSIYEINADSANESSAKICELGNIAKAAVASLKKHSGSSALAVNSVAASEN